MQVSIKKLPKSKAEIKITVAFEEFDKFFQKAISDLGKDLEIPGFRKGKVPKEIIEKTIGQEKILKEAAENVIRENYFEAVRQSADKIEVLGQPEIQILKLAPKNPLEFKATVSVMPEIKLPDYKEIASRIKRDKVEVSEKEIEDALKWLQKSRAKFTIKNRPAQKGDWVEIEYSTENDSPRESENGSQEDSHNFKDAFILGEGHFMQGFEENLIGMEAEQEKEFSLTQPREHSPAKEKFWVKLKSVQNMELPELNDQFARDLSSPLSKSPEKISDKKVNFENLNALKQSIETGLRQEKEIAEAQRVRQEILEKIAKESEMEIPEILIEEQKKRYLENLKKEVAQNLKISFEAYLKKVNKTELEILSSFQEPAQKQVETSLVLRQIQKKENIEASEEEVNQEVNKILKNYPNPEKAQKKFDPEKLKSYTKEVIRQEKTFAFLENL